MKALLTALFLLCLSTAPSLAAEPADSGETEDGCPTVYGTWRTAYVEDESPVTRPIPLQDLGPLPPRLPLKVTVEKGKATLTYANGKKDVFKELHYKKGNKNSYFNGANKHNNAIITSNIKLRARFFDDMECVFTLSFLKETDILSTTTWIVYMKPVK